MSEKFKVSVVIPVYNRAVFIKKAVDSAYILDEVGEIIIIDDGSTDSSLDICQHLQKKYDKISLFTHPKNQNLGVSASRNLGISKANFEYISFLDSDDYYLPNRFLKDKEILLNNPDIDGVYNALGIEYYNPEGKEKFINSGFEYQEFLTVSERIPPDELFLVLFNCHEKYKGDFSTDTITLRKEVFEKVGNFPVGLKQKEDIHLWRRVAAKCNLASGIINEPVAIRGVHENNTMTNSSIQPEADKIWWKDLNKWMNKNNTNKNFLECFKKSRLYYISRNSSKIYALISIIGFTIKYPKYIFQEYGSFDLNFMAIFNSNKFSKLTIRLKNKLFKKNIK